MRFNAGYTIEEHHPTVEDTEASLHLSGEVHVAGGVDNVDPMVLPVATGCRSSNGNPSLSFLIHPIHLCGPIIHPADLVGSPAVMKDHLSYGGLPRIDMSDDPDITNAFQWDCV
ncbi:MAG: hypothetical protein DDT24_00446 [Chloroflexi bacterium]|nr:hypothetical protein [Chloroflexota bacterium]